MSECIFCAIASGTAPASLVYEDDVAVGFLDLFPVHKGHTLIVPRTHVADLLDCPPDVAGHLMAVAQRLAPRVMRVAGGTGFNVWTANGAAAGQEVFHLHLHVLPRFDEDAFGLRFPAGYPKEADRSGLDTLAAQIRRLE